MAKQKYMNKKIKNILLLILLLSIALNIPVFADYQMVKTQIAEEGGRFVGKVFLNDTFICKFYSTDENNLKLKVNNVAARLEKIIYDSVDPEQIKCIAGKREAIVKTDKDILFSLAPAELSQGEFTAFNTAREYTDNLKNALAALPDVKIPKRIIVIPKGRTVEIKITGLSDNNYTLSDYDESIIEITGKQSDSIEVRGIEKGETKINFIYPPVKKQIIVIVKESAGSIPEGLRVTVTGNPAPANLVREAVTVNLHQKIEVKHNVRTAIDQKSVNKIGAVASGGSRTVTVPVTLSGENFITVKRNVYVQIENRPVALNTTTFLFASDRPETVFNNGKLFEGQIQDTGSHRLFFHHKCYEYSYPRNLQVRLVNDSAQGSSVYIIRGYCDNEYNELYSGFYGGRNFFTALLSRSGYVLDLKPNSDAVVLSSNLSPGEIVSGLMNFQVLRGALPKVIVQSSTYRHSSYAAYDLSEGKQVHPRGTFPNPDLKLSYKHYLGKDYTFIDIGGEPFLKEIQTGESCYGNYGAFYNVDISLINEDSDDKDCEIIFQARAGAVRAVLLIDGKLFSTPDTLHFTEEALLGTYTIGAGETRKVRILTFPMSGANYPAVIVVKSFRHR